MSEKAQNEAEKAKRNSTSGALERMASGCRGRFSRSEIRKELGKCASEASGRGRKARENVDASLARNSANEEAQRRCKR